MACTPWRGGGATNPQRAPRLTLAYRRRVPSVDHGQRLNPSRDLPFFALP